MPTAISLALGATLEFPPNKSRVGISFFQSSSTTASVATVAVNGILSFNVVGGNAPQRHFTLQDYGDLPMLRFLMTGATATPFTGLVVEYFMPEEYLAAGLDEFRRRYGK